MSDRCRLPSNMRFTDGVCSWCKGTGSVFFGQRERFCDPCCGTGKGREIVPCEHGENPSFCERCRRVKDVDLEYLAAEVRQEQLDRILGDGHGLTVRCDFAKRPATCAIYRGGLALSQPRSPQVFDKQVSLLAAVIGDQRRQGRIN